MKNNGLKLTKILSLLLLIVLAVACTPSGTEGELVEDFPPTPTPETVSADEDGQTDTTEDDNESPAIRPDANDDGQGDIRSRQWTLKAVEGADTTFKLDGPLPELHFGSDQLNGYSGCNGFGSVFRLKDGTLREIAIETNEQDCLDEVGVLEALLYDLLSSEPSIIVIDGDLVLRSGETALIFGQTDPISKVEGVEFTLQNYGGAAFFQMVAGVSKITLILENGQVNGWGGCNQYSGNYTTTGDQISITNLASTKVACANADIMQLEQQYYELLPQVKSFSLSGENLTFDYGDGFMGFTIVPENNDVALKNTLWELSAFRNGQMFDRVEVEEAITAVFSDGEINGFTGCNNYFGGFELGEGSQIKIGDVGQTRRACDQEIGQREALFVEALRTTTSYSIGGGELTLTHAAGELIFSAAGMASNENMNDEKSEPIVGGAEEANPVDVVIENGFEIREAVVERIELIEGVSSSDPAKSLVSVAVFGYLSDGCTEISHHDIEVEDDTVTIMLYTKRPLDQVCDQAIREFVYEVDLQDIGLTQGLYKIYFNGLQTSVRLD